DRSRPLRKPQYRRRPARTGCAGASRPWYRSWREATTPTRTPRAGVVTAHSLLDGVVLVLAGPVVLVVVLGDLAAALGLLVRLVGLRVGLVAVLALTARVFIVRTALAVAVTGVGVGVGVVDVGPGAAQPAVGLDDDRAELEVLLDAPVDLALGPGREAVAAG